MDILKYEISTPNFHGESYMELPELEIKYKSNTTSGCNVIVWFLSYSSGGVLFYNGPGTASKRDYIALLLVDYKLQLQYDLGSGANAIT